MAPHSSPLAWKIPWTEEPGGLQSVGSLRVGHDWATSLACVGEGNGNPLQCSCLEKPWDGGAWWTAAYGVPQSWTRLKWLSSSSSCFTDYTKTFDCVQFSSVAQSCRTLCDLMNHSTQASLSITNSRSPPKPMSIESVTPPSHLILCRPHSSHTQSFPASGSFQMSQLFASGDQSIGVSAST